MDEVANAKPKKQNKNIFLVIVGIILVVAMIVFVVVGTNKAKNASVNNMVNAVEEISSPIMEEYGCTIENVSVFEDCGLNYANYTINGYNKISNSDKYELADKLDGMSMPEGFNFSSIFLGEIFSDNNTYEIKGGSLYKNGSSVGSFKTPSSKSTDNSGASEKSMPLTDDGEKATCWSLAEKAVKDQLKSPSSAKFPFAYNSEGVSMFKTGSTIYVVAWVDAENSYGAMLRSDFAVTIEKNGSGKTATYTVTDCAIG